MSLLFLSLSLSYLHIYPFSKGLVRKNGYVAVNFLSQVIFVFLLFLGMVMYANEGETKEK